MLTHDFFGDDRDLSVRPEHQVFEDHLLGVLLILDLDLIDELQLNGVVVAVRERICGPVEYLLDEELTLIAKIR